MNTLEAKAIHAREQLTQLIDNSTHPEAPLTNAHDAFNVIEAIADFTINLALAHVAEITKDLVQTYARDHNTPPTKPDQPRP